MRWIRKAALIFLAFVALSAFFADALAPASYAHQFREEPDAAPSRQHLLGTDDLGRDRFSRLLYGTRVSLLCAPAAALVASATAGLLGGTAGFLGGLWEGGLMAIADLLLSLPTLFLLITARTLLPLDVSPLTSAVATFALLGCLSWAASARIVCSDVRMLRSSEMILQARASGSNGWRLLRRHIVPNLKPVLFVQFWISIPVFILAEANLSILGLGVAEPMPSWGSLLHELENVTATPTRPWQCVPLLLLIATVSCFHIIVRDGEIQP